MKIKQGFTIKKIADRTIVVPVGNKAINFNAMISLNSTARILFESLYEDRTREELVGILITKFDVSTEMAKSDVDKFISVLKNHNILE